MSIKAAFRWWIIVAALLVYEYAALNFHPEASILLKLGFDVNPKPGRTLSLWLGWIGIGLMLTMNVYTVRKKFTSLGGNLQNWLNFHIMCGLVGPTCILFHSNFKVRGVVAISFWSMIVASTSGVVGRYFYQQLVTKKSDLEDEARQWETELQKLQLTNTPPVAEERMQKIKQMALAYVGVQQNFIGEDGTITAGVVQVFISSLLGDMRLSVDLPVTLKELPRKSRGMLKNYALAERKSLFIEPFRNLMGYWHAFHFPFAIFMYAAAVIHIAASLLLGSGMSK